MPSPIHASPAADAAHATPPPASTAPPVAEALCPAGAPLTVLYDDACPLCRREIALYRDLPALQAVQYVDVHATSSPLPPGTTRAQLLARFHVQLADGRLVDGAAGFVALWAALPGWRWLARLAQLPGVLPLMALSYSAFLRVRPAMQRVAAAFEPPALHVPPALVPDLRSDHAGETGAVYIYRGLLAFSRDPAVRHMAREHLATEQDHLRSIAPLLPWPQRSRLLPAWRVAGFLTGALPALAGPRAVYATIAAVETFVDQHYREQLDRIDALPPAQRSQAAPLRALLARCREDECAHRDDAQSRLASAPGRLLRAWCSMVGSGSKAAVVLARRV